MDFGITNKTNEYLANLYQKNKTAGTAGNTSFLSAISVKAAEKTESVSFEEILKSKYPGAYYNVMDTSKINRGLWGRNDYPWDAYFKEPADDAVLDWKPAGAEPDMQSPQVQSKINSMAGKMSIVIPPELEEKMKNDPELAQQVMDRIDGFITKFYRPEANQGFLITFDENGEINNACIACEGRVTVSSSEFVEARKAREAKHAEYERIAEENALKRKLLQEAIDHRYYQTSVAKESVSAAYEANILAKPVENGVFDSETAGINA